jgi:hypothetical protein
MKNMTPFSHKEDAVLHKGFLHCTICSSTFTFMSCSVVSCCIFSVVYHGFILANLKKNSSIALLYHSSFQIGSVFDFAPGACLKTAVEYPKKYGDTVQYNLLAKEDEEKEKSLIDDEDVMAQLKLVILLVLIRQQLLLVGFLTFSQLILS